MTQHLEAFTVDENGEQNYWTRIGVAFPNTKGGLNLVLRAMPASIDGQYKIVVLPPKAKEADGPKAARRKT
jgi:hypothetical protein